MKCFKKCGFAKSKKLKIARFVLRLLFKFIDVVLKLDAIFAVLKNLGKG